MGLYVNPGKEAFEISRFSEVYIDKSMLISEINKICKTEQRFLCVSRPRRFGKSMAANMLAAYYSRGCDASELFSDLKVAQKLKKSNTQENAKEDKRVAEYLKHLNQHNVIRFDVQRFIFDEKHFDLFINEIQSVIIHELQKEYVDLMIEDSYGLPKVLDQIYSYTKQGFIFIVDEWDCVFRFAKEDKEIQKKYLNFLRGLFKGAEYVELVYMTGILPIKKYGEHSALNIFKEYSMTHPVNLSEYFGFTEEEVLSLCNQYHIDFTEMQRWYDGYHLKEFHIYNPKAVIDVVLWGEFQSYWTGTETYEALKIHIEQNFDGLKESVITMLGGGHCKINTSKFQNDMTTFHSKDDVLTLLIHLGYLSYDKRTTEVFIPNQEIIQEFLNVVEEPGWDGLVNALSRSEDLLRSTWALDGEAVALGINAIHSETTSILQYNNENSLACALYIAYYSAKAYYANPIQELPSGKGFADVVYLPLRSVGRPALVVELKWDKSAKGAIEQIKNKQYEDWILSYTGDILLVGINYNKDTKKHQCIIEQYKKD